MLFPVTNKIHIISNYAIVAHDYNPLGYNVTILSRFCALFMLTLTGFVDVLWLVGASIVDKRRAIGISCHSKSKMYSSMLDIIFVDKFMFV